jgi:hypothetical protein
MTPIRKFSDGSSLTFDEGAFDSWCVYLERPGNMKYAPTDAAYFSDLQKLGRKHGYQRIYDDIVSFYCVTTGQIDQQTMNLISELSGTYGEDALDIEIIFTTIHAGMIAEENKQFSKIGKRIKRLGLHQTLLDGMSPEDAANFSKGKKWRELDKLCLAKGFQSLDGYCLVDAKANQAD